MVELGSLGTIAGKCICVRVCALVLYILFCEDSSFRP